MKFRDFMEEGIISKVGQKIQQKQFDRYIKKATEKSSERRMRWDEYGGVLNLMENYAKAMIDDAKRAKNTPGYNLDNMLNKWEGLVKDLKKFLIKVDKGK